MAYTINRPSKRKSSSSFQIRPLAQTYSELRTPHEAKSTMSHHEISLLGVPKLPALPTSVELRTKSDASSEAVRYRLNLKNLSKAETRYCSETRYTTG